MKTIISDSINKRQITLDFNKKSLTIVGDYAPSSITSYCIFNRFSDKTYFIFINREHAYEHCDYLNKENNTDTFFVSSRTIFI